MQIVFKCMKRCSASLMVREMQMKYTASPSLPYLASPQKFDNTVSFEAVRTRLVECHTTVGLLGRGFWQQTASHFTQSFHFWPRNSTSKKLVKISSKM